MSNTTDKRHCGSHSENYVEERPQELYWFWLVLSLIAAAPLQQKERETLGKRSEHGCSHYSCISSGEMWTQLTKGSKFREIPLPTPEISSAGLPRTSVSPLTVLFVYKNNPDYPWNVICRMNRLHSSWCTKVPCKGTAAIASAKLYPATCRCVGTLPGRYYCD